MPELLGNPMLDMAKGMTLPQVAQFSEGRLTEDVLAQVDEALKAL